MSIVRPHNSLKAVMADRMRDAQLCFPLGLDCQIQPLTGQMVNLKGLVSNPHVGEETSPLRYRVALGGGDLQISQIASRRVRSKLDFVHL